MPIERVPVVHKFGIISQSHRLQIQERILEEAKEARDKEKLGTSVKSTRPSYLLGEISEDFVRTFRYEKDLHTLSKMEKQAEDILNRIKRRLTTLHEQTSIDYNAVAKSWIDLSLLSQCSGKIQESALDTLIDSLGSGLGFDVGLLPAVMYLGEATVYWLRYRVMRDDFLRSSEIKLLKAGELVFDRLLCYYVIGDLIGHEDFMNRMKGYNDGFFEESEQIYSNYPTIVQSLGYISRCIDLIAADSQTNNENSAETMKSLPYAFNQSKALSDNMGDFSEQAPLLWLVLRVQMEVASRKLGSPRKEQSKLQSCQELVESSRLTNLNKLNSLTLISGLKLLTNIASKNMNVLKAMQKLVLTTNPETCTPHIQENIVLDQNESRSDMSRLSHHMSQRNNSLGSIPGNQFHPTSFSDGELQSLDLSMEDEPNSVESRHLDPNNEMPSSNRSERSLLSTTRLQNSLERIKENESPPPRETNATNKQTSLRANALVYSEENRAPSKSLITEEDIAWDNLALVDRHLWNNAPFHRSTNEPLQSPPEGLDSRPFYPTDSQTRASPGRPSEARSSRHLNNSPKLTFLLATDRSSQSATHRVKKRWPNFSEWPSEVAIAYTKLVALIVEKGSSADIRKAALLGAHSNEPLYKAKNYSYQNIGTSNCGLLDLMYFKTEGCEWCWKIRFTALECMVRMYNKLEGISTMDGIRNICWAAIQDSCNRDPDHRVAEARKLGSSKLVNSSEKSGNLTKKVIVSSEDQITDAEVALYGRVLTTLTNQSARIDRNASNKENSLEPKKKGKVSENVTANLTPEQPKLTNVTRENRAVKPSIRDQLELHGALCEKPVGWADRNRVGLSRVVEDQWRKELHLKGSVTATDSLQSTPEPSNR